MPACARAWGEFKDALMKGEKMNRKPGGGSPTGLSVLPFTRPVFLPCLDYGTAVYQIFLAG